MASACESCTVYARILDGERWRLRAGRRVQCMACQPEPLGCEGVRPAYASLRDDSGGQPSRVIESEGW